MIVVDQMLLLLNRYSLLLLLDLLVFRGRLMMLMSLSFLRFLVDILMRLGLGSALFGCLICLPLDLLKIMLINMLFIIDFLILLISNLI